MEKRNDSSIDPNQQAQQQENRNASSSDIDIDRTENRNSQQKNTTKDNTKEVVIGSATRETDTQIKSLQSSISNLSIQQTEDHDSLTLLLDAGNMGKVDLTTISEEMNKVPGVSVSVATRGGSEIQHNSLVPFIPNKQHGDEDLRIREKEENSSTDDDDDDDDEMKDVQRQFEGIGIGDDEKYRPHPSPSIVAKPKPTKNTQNTKSTTRRNNPNNNRNEERTIKKEELTFFDVLVMRGPLACNHSGNIYYRSLILENKPVYDNSDKKTKTHITWFIVKKIQEVGGKFYKPKDKTTGVLVEISEKAVRRKVAQALRDTGRVFRGKKKTDKKDDAKDADGNSKS